MTSRKRRRVMAALPVGTGGARSAARSIQAVQPADASDALEAAVGWLSRIGQGLDERAERDFRAWLDADAVHRQVLFEIAEIYDELNVMASVSSAPSDVPMPEEPRASGKVM